MCAYSIHTYTFSYEFLTIEGMLSGALLSIFLLGYFLPFTNKIVSILVNFMKNTLSKGVLRNVFRGLHFFFFLGQWGGGGGAHHLVGA